MATATKPKPRKIVNSSINGKPLNSEILLVNTLNSIQLDIRELRTDIKSLDEKLSERIDSNFKWTLGIMATLIVFVFTVMFFLHSDLKTAVKQNSESINQIDQKLDKLLRK